MKPATLFSFGVLALTICYPARKAGATGFVWDDGAADGDWANPINWVGNTGYPDGNDDTATITNSGRWITVPGGLTIGELTMDGTYAGTVSLSGSLVVDDLVENGSLTLNAGTLQTASNTAGNVTIDGALLIATGGVFIVNRSSTAGLGAGQAITAAAITIDAGGIMHADRRGFDEHTGPGVGVSASVGSGAGHGGRGGVGIDHLARREAGGVPYDSFTSPIALGSGGGKGSWKSGSTGGKGGGAITLNVPGTLRVDGRLSADGQAGSSGFAGGGSGGTLSIAAAILAGTGSIQAIGGRGSSNGGGGGGGRIDVDQVGTFQFEGDLSVAGGLTDTRGGLRGHAGTIDWPTDFNLTLGSGTHEITFVHMGFDGSNEYDFGSATLTINSGGTLSMDGDPIANNTNGGGATITASNVIVEVGGLLTAESLGFDLKDGPGRGTTGHAGGGGAYGGDGGDGNENVTTWYVGGTAYGNATNPVYFGSGGGIGTWFTGDDEGRGGGAVMLVVPHTLRIDGTVSAHGGGDSTWRAYCGGGAGGTVSLTAMRLEGNGTIIADGGNGNDRGGGGGGGRILIAGYHYKADLEPFTGTVSADKGVGPGAGTDGTDGTIHWFMPPPPKGTVVFFK